MITELGTVTVGLEQANLCCSPPRSWEVTGPGVITHRKLTRLCWFCS